MKGRCCSTCASRGSTRPATSRGRNVAVSELKGRLRELEPFREKTVVVYCRSGHRSAIAAGILRDAGFTRVYDLGSIHNW